MNNAELRDAVTLAIAAVRNRASEAASPLAVARVLDTAAACMVGKLGDDTFADASFARVQLTESGARDRVSEAAWQVSIAAVAARDARDPRFANATERCVDALTKAATHLARSVAA